MKDAFVYVTMRTRSIVATSLTLAVVFWAGSSRSATVSVCREAITTVTHPAEYIEEKVKRGGLRCFIQPHCCTPAWVVSPDCYFFRHNKVRDAWDEIVKTLTCSDDNLDPATAFNQWLRSFQQPVPGFDIRPLKPVADLFGVYVTAAYDAAKPIPDEIRQKLVQYAGQNPPYSSDDIKDARYLYASHPLAKRIWPGSKMGNRIRNAITYYNLIIVRDGFAIIPECENISQLAHELTHVAQYRRMGWQTFLESYLSSGIASGGNATTTPLELVAYHVQRVIFDRCAKVPGSLLTGASPVRTPITASTSDGTIEIINDLVKSGDLKIQDGRVTECSKVAIEKLKSVLGTVDCGPIRKVRVVPASARRRP